MSVQLHRILFSCLVGVILFHSAWTASSPTTKSWLNIFPESDLIKSNNVSDDVLCFHRAPENRCPQSDTIFVYYDCCGGINPNCCPRNRMWVYFTIFVLPVLMVSIFLILMCMKLATVVGGKYDDVSISDSESALDYNLDTIMYNLLQNEKPHKCPFHAAQERERMLAASKTPTANGMNIMHMPPIIESE